jgi:glycosyltransferase involved in cell wall biosynthesis
MKEGTGVSPSRPLLLFVVNVDWFFLSHRLPLAQAARDAGFEVVVVAAETGRSAEIRREGFGFVPFAFSRRGVAILEEAKSIFFLARLYRRLRPDLVHHVTIKPVLYGSLASRMVGGIKVINAVSGLGYTFTSNERARVVRAVATLLYRATTLTPNSRTIFQNPDDLEAFVSKGLVKPRQAVLIRGSGVDCARFRATEEPKGAPVVVLPSRMLLDKGVGEFVEAARIVRRSLPEARFVLVGDSDPGNPTGVLVEKLEAWMRAGEVEWWGHRSEMPEVLAGANLVVLPSYREGLPKVLLEAAASSRAIVATDVPGCREIVRHGVNGLLVPPHDGEALARAVRDLLENPELRERFGRAGREIAVSEFAEGIVVEQTLNLYKKLLRDRWPQDSGRAIRR